MKISLSCRKILVSRNCCILKKKAIRVSVFRLYFWIFPSPLTDISLAACPTARYHARNAFWSRAKISVLEFS